MAKLFQPEDVKNYFKTMPFLDVITGAKGFPYPCIAEFAGAKNSGKSTIGQFMPIWFLKDNPKNKALYIDSEGKLDAVRFVNFLLSNNLKEDNIKVIRNNYVNEIIPIIHKFLTDCYIEGRHGIVVWDSIANVTILPQKKKGKGKKNDVVIEDKSTNDMEAGGGYSDAKVTAYMSSEFPKLSDIVEKTKSVIILINQVRQNMGGRGYKTKRGEYIKHIISLQLFFKGKTKEHTLGSVKISDELLSTITVKKNHVIGIVNVPIIVPIKTDRIDYINSFMETAKSWGIIKSTGAWKYIEIGDEKCRWKNEKEFSALVAKDDKIVPMLKYMVYKKFLYDTLFRVRVIDEVWKLEEKLGLPKTQLTPQELDLHNYFTEKK